MCRVLVLNNTIHSQEASGVVPNFFICKIGLLLAILMVREQPSLAALAFSSRLTAWDIVQLLSLELTARVRKEERRQAVACDWSCL